MLDIRHDGSPVMRYGPAQSNLVGARLPHVWLGAGQSIYDVLGDGLTLLVFASAPRVGAMVAAAAARGVPLVTVDLGDADLRQRYGTDMLLVRPDQYVVWQADLTAAEVMDFGAVLDRVRGVSPPDDPAATAGGGARRTLRK